MTSFALKFEFQECCHQFLMLSTLVKKADKYIYNSGVLKNAMKNCCDYCFENCQRISVKIALEIALEILKLPGNSLGALEIALEILKMPWK